MKQNARYRSTKGHRTRVLVDPLRGKQPALGITKYMAINAEAGYPCQRRLPPNVCAWWLRTAAPNAMLPHGVYRIRDTRSQDRRMRPDLRCDTLANHSLPSGSPIHACYLKSVQTPKKLHLAPRTPAARSGHRVVVCVRRAYHTDRPRETPCNAGWRRTHIAFLPM